MLIDLFGGKGGADERGRTAEGVPQSEQEDRGLPVRMPQRIIDEKDVARANEILARYKQGKVNLENRIVEDEQWWEGRHWEAIRKGRMPDHRHVRPEPTSGWLFNAILNKHADAMDNYPEPVVLPREKSDEQSARALSEVLPVVLEYNDFEKTYSDNWWEKLKHGTGCYGVFWDSQKDNGMGDISIRKIDLLNIFWEPGITDIQESRNLFITALVDEDILEQQYPEHKGKLKGNAVDVKQYIYDDTVDLSHKTVVVDWYYKTREPSGRTLLHYVKFCGNELLYASQNDPQYRDSGWYEHGCYPVVMDSLFPEKGTPVGFGYVAICKGTQIYIDSIDANILENSMMATRKRFFVSANTAVNEEELKDWNEPIIHVEGELGEARLQELTVRPLDSIYYSVMQGKIEEMKDTAANRDVNSGGNISGVTAASAIAALQEAGNKASRDMIAASYRAYREISRLCIELMRQFYDESRSFRIIRPNNEAEFVEINNSQMGDQLVGVDAQGMELYRRPVYDLKITAQKKNPFSRAAQNELAREFYSLGFFTPERAQEALLCLDMMEFEGKDKIVEQISRGETLYNTCMQQQQQIAQLAQIVQGLTGHNMQPEVSGGGEAFPSSPTGGGRGASATAAAAQKSQGNYTDRIVKHSAVDVNRQ